MPSIRSNPIQLYSLLVSLTVFMGCTDGPWYQLKRANPYFRNQWAADRQLGPTFEDRMKEVRLVKDQIPRMSASDQSKWVSNLEKLYANDPSPDMRREAVLALGKVKDPTAMVVLQKAAQDESEKVRMAVCDSLGVHNDAESLALLGKLTKSDESTSVKVAAIRSLGNYKGEDAKALLADSIQDRSPAIQYQSSVSLAKVTGEDFGGDVALWRKYLNGEAVEKPEVSIAERMSSIMKINR